MKDSQMYYVLIIVVSTPHYHPALAAVLGIYFLAMQILSIRSGN